MLDDRGGPGAIFLAAAREVQQLLLLDAMHSTPGFQVQSAYQPTQQVGGDFFQVAPLRDGRILVMVGDVSGKGLKAAMNVSLIVGAIKMVAESTSSPAAILTELNAGLHGRLQNGFATCLALALAPDGTCTSATAGHPAPFLNDREIDLPGSLPLGMLSTAEYTETVTPLRQGDLLTLYSDGLLEARGKGGELYGFARLQSLIATRPSAQQALQAAIDFGQDDDITVLTITRLPLPHPELVAHATPVLAPA